MEKEFNNQHPYLGQAFLKKKADEKRILSPANKGRNERGKAVETTYYLTAESKRKTFQGIEKAIRMMLIHGTTIFRHPDGIKAGIEAIKLAVEVVYKGIIKVPDLKRYAKLLGKKELPCLEHWRKMNKLSIKNLLRKDHLKLRKEMKK